MKAGSCLIVICLLAASPPICAANADRPSRQALKGCVWEKASDAAVGLEAWVERCDFGFRKIDFVFESGSLAIRYSDGGAKPDPVIDVLDMKPGESYEAGLRRLFTERTDTNVAAKCVLAPYRGDKPPSGVRRYTFVPNAAYQKELDANANPNEVPDPPCGDWGTTPDGIQYFEIHPAGGVRRALFVRVGQDEPLFDEKTLRLLPPR